MSVTKIPSQRVSWHGPDTELQHGIEILVFKPVSLTTLMVQAWLWAQYTQHTVCGTGTEMESANVIDAGKVEWKSSAPHPASK